MINDQGNELFFSAVNLWEVAIKQALGKRDFQIDPRLLRRGLLDNGYNEISVSCDHAIAVRNLPPIHKDPFDRMLVAQAVVDGLTLLTADSVLARYPGPVQRV